MPVSTAGEAEASGVPTGGLTLSMSTEDPGEGVTLVSVHALLHLFLEFGGISSGSSHWSSSPACKVQGGSLVGPSPSRLGSGGPGLR